jgi:hypothetical protein
MQKSSKVENLQNEINQLENQISQLKNNNEYYTKFEQTAREKLNLIMKERRWILSLAANAVIESMKQDQFKKILINGETGEVHQDKFLNLCEVIFDKLLKQLMDMTLNVNTNKNPSFVDAFEGTLSIESA